MLIMKNDVYYYYSVNKNGYAIVNPIVAHDAFENNL